MKIYKSRVGKLPGSSYQELIKNARRIYHGIEKQTNRTPYIKSDKHSYFKGQKIFLNLYFVHLDQKSRIDRKRRLRYFEAGLDLLKHNTYAPLEKPNPNKSGEQLLRFAGVTPGDELFYVQVRKNSRGNHYYMSVFAPE
jgi:hypothetical protein